MEFKTQDDLDDSIKKLDEIDFLGQRVTVKQDVSTTIVECLFLLSYLCILTKFLQIVGFHWTTTSSPT